MQHHWGSGIIDPAYVFLGAAALSFWSGFEMHGAWERDGFWFFKWAMSASVIGALAHYGAGLRVEEAAFAVITTGKFGMVWRS